MPTGIGRKSLSLSKAKFWAKVRIRTQDATHVYNARRAPWWRRRFALDWCSNRHCPSGGCGSVLSQRHSSTRRSPVLTTPTTSCLWRKRTHYSCCEMVLISTRVIHPVTCRTVSRFFFSFLFSVFFGVSLHQVTFPQPSKSERNEISARPSGCCVDSIWEVKSKRPHAKIFLGCSSSTILYWLRFQDEILSVASQLPTSPLFLKGYFEGGNDNILKFFSVPFTNSQLTCETRTPTPAQKGGKRRIISANPRFPLLTQAKIYFELPIHHRVAFPNTNTNLDTPHRRFVLSLANAACCEICHEWLRICRATRVGGSNTLVVVSDRPLIRHKQ